MVSACTATDDVSIDYMAKVVLADFPCSGYCFSIVMNKYLVGIYKYVGFYLLSIDFSIL